MEVRMADDIHFAKVLREHGFRATFGRVAVLEALAKAGKPVAVETLAKNVVKHIDAANVYRALDAFVEAGLVVRVDVGHRHWHYELAVLMSHHHHLICESCGFRPAHV